MVHYFPSCNFTRLRPEASEAAKNLMASLGVQVEGCCRPGHKKLETGETALTVCQTCDMIIGEGAPQAAVQSAWEYLDSLTGHVWPDHTGERIILQDCWRARNNRPLQDAVRSLLYKMGYEVAELPDNREKTTFDGEWLYKPVMPGNLKLAPKAFARIEPHVTLLSPEEQKARMVEYCSHLDGKSVVYCNACLTGLLDGGADAVHLMELLTGTEKR